MIVIVTIGAAIAIVGETSAIVSVHHFHGVIKENDVCKHPQEVSPNKEDNHESDPAKQEIVIE